MFMKKALVIIDMQNLPFVWKDYGGNALYREEILLANTNLLIQKARNASAPVFHVLYTEKGNSMRAENQPLWQIHFACSQLEQDERIIKYHADSFLKTTLKERLLQHEITELVFCGIQTEYCVDTTVKSAYSHGFSCELAADAHSTYDSEHLSAEQIVNHYNHTITQFAQVKTAQEIVF